MTAPEPESDDPPRSERLRVLVPDNVVQMPYEAALGTVSST